MNCNVDVQFKINMVEFQSMVHQVFSNINNVPGEEFYALFKNIKPKYTRTISTETVVLSISQTRVTIYGYNKQYGKWGNPIGYCWTITGEYVNTEIVDVTFRTFEHFAPEVFQYVIGYSTNEQYFKPHVFS